MRVTLRMRKLRPRKVIQFVQSPPVITEAHLTRSKGPQCDFLCFGLWLGRGHRDVREGWKVTRVSFPRSARVCVRGPTQPPNPKLALLLPIALVCYWVTSSYIDTIDYLYLTLINILTFAKPLKGSQIHLPPQVRHRAPGQIRHARLTWNWSAWRIETFALITDLSQEPGMVSDTHLCGQQIFSEWMNEELLRESIKYLHRFKHPPVYWFREENGIIPILANNFIYYYYYYWWW